MRKRLRTIHAYDLEAGQVLRMNRKRYVVRAVEGTSIADACCTDEIAVYVTELTVFHAFPSGRLGASFIVRMPRMDKVQCDS
jgi:hypothetical protein